ncbi:integrase, catalytic region, zinc finger, CCHC-type containing protein [Tanacetum coccineum]
MSQEIMNIVANSVDILDVKKSCVNACNKCLKLETELFKKKDFIEKEAYDKLVKRKNVVNIAVSKPNATVAPGMYKLDIEALSPRLKNNRDAHEVYIEKTIEYTDTLRGFVESARTQNPKVKPTTSYSRSKPPGNTKNNRITRPPRSNQKNKEEDHSKNVKSSLNKKNSISEPISNALVKRFVRNAKFKSMCAICNKCLFDANHDMCLINHVNDVNVRSKSKSKRNKKRKAWKPTGHLDRPLGNVIISRVYYVEGLRHKLFSVRQFCDADLEVAFRKNTCFIQNLEGVDLLSGSHDTNLYTISLDDMLKTSPICLISKASKTKSWLWHRHLSHLNFGTLNKLAKDEAPDAIIKCIKNIQVRLNAAVRNVRIYNGTEFVNQTLRDFYENVGISHQTSVAHTP